MLVDLGWIFKIFQAILKADTQFSADRPLPACMPATCMYVCRLSQGSLNGWLLHWLHDTHRVPHQTKSRPERVLAERHPLLPTAAVLNSWRSGPHVSHGTPCNNPAACWAALLQALPDVSGAVDVPNRQPSSQEPKHQEGLCASLVLDIILDGVRDEVLDLEEDLHAPSQT